MTTAQLPDATRTLSERMQDVLPAAAGGAFCVLVVLEYSGGFGVLSKWSPVSPYTGTLVLCAGVALLRLAWGRTRMLWTPVLATMGYVVAETISYTTSSLSPATTGAELDEDLKLLVYVTVICLLAAELRAWHHVALAIVVPMAVISLLAVVNQFLLGNAHSFLGFETVTDYLGIGVNTARHAGPLPDPNFWGRFLVIGLPFSLALVKRAWAHGRRGLAYTSATAFVLLLCGVYLTGSRGTFLAAGAGVIIYFVCVGVRPLHGLLGLLATGLLLLIPGVGTRLLSVLSVTGSAQLAAGDQSVQARLATQRVAWTMIKEHPFTGVGPGGYFDAFGQYAARGEVSIDRVLAPHDLYLGLWAQVGLIGLLAFCAVLALGLGLAARTIWITRGMTSADAQQTRPYAAAVLAAIAAWCVASVFLQLTYARIVFLLIVLSAAMWRQASLLPQVRSTALSARSMRRVGTAIVGASLGAAAAVACVVLLPRSTSATRVAAVAPVQTDGPFGSYLTSLRTRTSIVPGYAVVVDVSAPTPVDAQGSARDGTVTVTATGDDHASAVANLDDAVLSGDAAVHQAGMDRVFTLDWQPGTDVVRNRPGPATTVGSGVVGALVGAGIGLGAGRLRERAEGGGRHE